MPIITGNQGPFSPDAPGSYGGNASYQVLMHKANLASTVQLAESTVQVTPEDSFVRQSPEAPAVLSKKGLDDYFRYAEQDIVQLDKDRDGKLSEQELQPVFKDKPATEDTAVITAAEQAHKMFQAAKQNIDPADTQAGKPAGLDAVDVTSYLIAQDAPKQLFAGMGFDGLIDAAQDEYKKAYAQFYPGETLPDMKWDGKISPAEAAATDKLIQGKTTNAQVGIALKGLQQGLQLKDNYQQYRTRVQQHDATQTSTSSIGTAAQTGSGESTPRATTPKPPDDQPS